MTAALVLALAGGGVATASSPDRSSRAGEDSAVDHQHGGTDGHLAASRKNVDLVGKLELSGQFGNVVPGQIADLAVYGDYAYLNSWAEETCTRGGFYVADISNPERPREVAFVPALPKNYHGEGAHVISVSTRSFTGDLLAVNNETCASTTVGGGFDLYDVTDPRNPVALVRGAGDFGGEGQLNGPGTKANEYHSVFLWNDDGRTYLVASDNEELHDVDVFDVSDPRSPRPVGEWDLLESFPQIAETPMPYGNLVLNHDMVVKEVDGRDTMLASYWDAGYVMLDVENPGRPSYIRDTDFGATDPLVPGISPPEGNAHQAEFSFDNTYVLAADEDFNPYRADQFFVGEALRESSEVGGGTSVAALPDLTLSGKVVYGGYACPQDPNLSVPQAADYDATELGTQAGDEKILLVQRGPFGDPTADYDGDGRIYDNDDACFPGQKAANAFDAGWDAVVIVNRHPTSGSAAADEAYCGSGGYEPDKPMVTVCTTHAAMHELFGTAPQFESPYTETAPALGAVSSARVRATSKFDGWGYAHLYRTSDGQRLDSYAVPQALDPAYAFGSGDLSIHEFATDPGRELAYSAYYSAGVRVFAFDGGDLRDVGHYIARGGSNFWGIETFQAGSDASRTLRGRQLFAGSDRDHGLWIFRYTG